MEKNATKKESLIGLYLAACLILLFGEPTSDSILVFIGYYIFALANLWNAARLANKLEKLKNGKSDIATNRKGISQRTA